MKRRSFLGLLVASPILPLASAAEEGRTLKFGPRNLRFGPYEPALRNFEWRADTSEWVKLDPAVPWIGPTERFVVTA